MSKKPIEPAAPIAPFIGGKGKMASVICDIIDHHDHQTYAEPFVGMGGIFLRRKRQPRGEFINDFNCEITNLFRILQNHYDALIAHIEWRLTSRDEFDRLRAIDPTQMTDLERAARFLYLQRLAYGGKPVDQGYWPSKESRAKFNVARLLPRLKAAHQRLGGVNIENLHYPDFIKNYDRASTLFYLDPPYYGRENFYGKNMFSRQDFDQLASILQDIRGSFIMSINDAPVPRAIFAAFHIRNIQTQYSVKDGQFGNYSELLISNFDLGGAA